MFLPKEKREFIKVVEDDYPQEVDYLKYLHLDKGLEFAQYSTLALGLWQLLVSIQNYGAEFNTNRVIGLVMMTGTGVIATFRGAIEREPPELTEDLE